MKNSSIKVQSPKSGMLRLLICLRAPWPSFWILNPTPTPSPGSRGPTSPSEFQIVWSKCHHHPPRFHSAHKSPSLPTPPLTATIFHISFSVSKQKKITLKKIIKTKIPFASLLRGILSSSGYFRCNLQRNLASNPNLTVNIPPRVRPIQGHDFYSERQ